MDLGFMEAESYVKVATRSYKSRLSARAKSERT